MDILYLVIALIVVILIISTSYIYFLNRFFTLEKDKREAEIKLSYSNSIIPHKLQAYERMTLFLERIKPASLTRRISAIGSAKEYEYVLIEAIQTEFEHNLAQQIYIYPETWQIIFSAKNATQLFIKQSLVHISNNNATAKDFQEELIKRSSQEVPASVSAILYLQKDIQKMM